MEKDGWIDLLCDLRRFCSDARKERTLIEVSEIYNVAVKKC